MEEWEATIITHSHNMGCKDMAKAMDMDATIKDMGHIVQVTETVPGCQATVQDSVKAIQDMEVQVMESMTGNTGHLNFSKECTIQHMVVEQILADKLPTGNNTRWLQEMATVTVGVMTIDPLEAMVPTAVAMVAMVAMDKAIEE
jgi:hypothetical protein